MIKTRFFQNNYLVYIRALLLLKRSLVCGDPFLLYTVQISYFYWLCNFLRVFPDCTFPWNIFVVNIVMYVRMIQWQKWIFIYIRLYLIQKNRCLMCSLQHRFLSSNTTRNFQHSDGSISLLFIVDFGRRSGVSCLLLCLWKKEYTTDEVLYVKNNILYCHAIEMAIEKLLL